MTEFSFGDEVWAWYELVTRTGCKPIIRFSGIVPIDKIVFDFGGD